MKSRVDDLVESLPIRKADAPERIRNELRITARYVVPDLDVGSEKDLRGTCPFCGSPDRFEYNWQRSTWRCNHRSECNRSGNFMTLLAQYAQMINAETPKERWGNLAAVRGMSVKWLKKWGKPSSLGARPLPVEILRDHLKMGWCPNAGKQGRWILPILKESPTGNAMDDYPLIHGFRIYDIFKGEKKMFLRNLPRFRPEIWNGYRLEDQKTKDWPVILCEGEWDGGCLEWLVEMAGEEYIVVATPGTDIHAEWFEKLRGRHILWPWDNDKAGRDGIWKHMPQMERYAGKVEYIKWPSDYLDGGDVRDYVIGGILERRLKPEVVFESFRDRFKATFPHIKNYKESEPMHRPKGKGRTLKAPTFRKTIRQLREVLEWDRALEDAFRVSFATIYSVRLEQGDPVWMHIVAPPGTGKSTVAQAGQDVPDCEYVSRIKSSQLISGYREPGKKKDETLDPTDPKMNASVLLRWNNKCVIFKEWTEILELPPLERNAILSTLRGVFDGSGDWDFGNNQSLHLKDIKLSMLACTTEKIYKTDSRDTNQAHVGDRFLKFKMRTRITEQNRVTDLILRMQEQQQTTMHMVKSISYDFLNRDIPDPLVHLKFMSRDQAKYLEHLASYVSVLRAAPDKSSGDYGGREVTYDQTAARESPARVAKQLHRLGRALMIVDGELDGTLCTEKVWRLLEKVAMDTVWSYRQTVYHALCRLRDRGKVRVTAEEVFDTSHSLPRKFSRLESKDRVHRELQNMSLVGSVVWLRKASKANPGENHEYALSDESYAVWCGLGWGGIKVKKRRRRK